MDAPAPPAPVYPIPLPDPDDPRFTFGLLHDVIGVIAAHGYPPIHAPADLVRFQQALFTSIYQREETP